MLDIALALCTQIYVYDGDNIRATCEGKRATYRMATIDAPEIKGLCAAERRMAVIARDYLQGVVARPGARLKEIQCSGSNYGRKCAIVLVNGENALASPASDPYHCTPKGCPKRRNWCR
jgi:endonuclease YncB( thermonuclease family)